jgi:hypothetical protein
VKERVIRVASCGGSSLEGDLTFKAKGVTYGHLIRIDKESTVVYGRTFLAGSGWRGFFVSGSFYDKTKSP